jgi:hypothetical protein
MTFLTFYFGIRERFLDGNLTILMCGAIFHFHMPFHRATSSWAGLITLIFFTEESSHGAKAELSHVVEKCK